MTKRNSLVSQYLPADLRGPGGSALPLADGPELFPLWDRQDAYTTEHCGFPFFPTILSTQLACTTFPSDTPEFPVDLGPCLDPREHPEAIPDRAKMIEILRALGASVRS